MTLALDISIEAAGWRDMPAAQAAIKRAIEATLADAGRADVEIGVVLADDPFMRGLNRQWLGRDEPTNVLSFPAPEGPGPAQRFLGDVVFALETIRREARRDSKPFDHHLAHLAVHGVLHLLGFDHARDADAESMERRERRILMRLNIPDPYASTDPQRTVPA